MFGISEKEEGVPVLDVPEVRVAIEKANAARLVVEKLEADEARLLRIVNPAPNDPSRTDEERDEAVQRLDIAKGTQSGWHLPELKTARDAHRLALAELAAARSEAVAKLDAIRREARKPLVASVVAALETYHEAREALLEFDARWDLDRATSQDAPERTLIEPIVSKGQVEGLKSILKSQGWL